MFKILYVNSFLRNIVIFMILTPYLIFYIISLVYRIPNYDTEQMLAYVSSTGDLSYLENPAVSYGYFYADLDEHGYLIHFDAVESDPLYNAKMHYLDQVKQVYYDGAKQRFNNVLPDNMEYNHKSINGNYFSSRIVFDESGGSKLYVLHRQENVATRSVMQRAGRANRICMVIACLFCMMVAYFEVRPARKAWKHQKQFIAQTSHELRTPITVIQTAVELCEHKDVFDEDVKKNHKIISNELAIMSNAVADLMLLSKIDAKQIRLEKQSVELVPLLLDVCMSSEVLAAQKGIEVARLECQDAINVYGDETLLHQLVAILMKNAIEYTQPGGKVELQASKTRNKVCIAVKDNGVGIPKKELHNIFSRFYRVHPEQPTNKGNSGLGLAIAKWIVKRHHGSIHVESTIGAGSIFTVVLPCK